MKKGINAWSFPNGTGVPEMIAGAKDAGYEGIELVLDEIGGLDLQTPDSTLREWKALASNIGVGLPSLATGLYWQYSFTSSENALRAKALEVARRQIHAAHELGAAGILVVPGLVGGEGANNVRYDTAFERALEGIMSLEPEARSANVIIGVENVWNKFLLSPSELRDFVDAANSPFVRIYFDVGNVLLYGYPEHYIRVLGGRIALVHVKDFRTGVGTLDGFVNLLCGDVNFPAVIQAFEEIGYDGYLTAEIGPYKYYPELTVYNTSAALGKIMGR